MLKRKCNICIFLVLLLAGQLLSGCRDQTARTLPAKAPVEVDVVTLTAHPQKLEVELPGRTAAYRIAEVRPQVNGIIKKRLFTEGNVVKAGDILYQIDPAMYQAKLASAEAGLAKARAVEHLAQLKAKRYTFLANTKAVSEMDQAEIEAGWKEAKADVAAAEAQMSSASIDLDYTRITAPISGRIGKSMISEGALVTAQQSTPLAIIQQLDPLYIDVTQPSTEMLRLKKNLSADLESDARTVNSKVTILLEDGSEYGKTGSLEFSDATVNQSTGTVTLRAIVANPEQELLPGMFVRARITTGVRQDAILVPADSISRNAKGQAFVMIVTPASIVESRIIVSGPNIGGKVLVNEGLVAGEQVIVAGLQKIRPGVKVSAVELKNPTSGQLALKTKGSASTTHAE